MKTYNPQEIEKKWQVKWEKMGGFPAEDFDKKPKFYNLMEFPYPSGSGLHVGHCMGYTASDVYSRMKRMQGYNVLFPIGWDAFGLPTENFAIKTGRKPAEVTKENTDIFRKQMKSLAYSFDWGREINTTDPSYYKWTQWIFLQFYKHAYIDGKLVEVADDDKTTPRLAYQAEMPINWCPSCKIGLANEEVIDGKCERCGAQTFKKMQKQWMLRITAYADRLINDLDKTDYLEKIKTQQINWMGRSEGTNIKFKIVIPATAEKQGSGVDLRVNPPAGGRDDNNVSEDDNNFIEVFTTRADTLFGCTYVVVAPESDYMANLKPKITNLKEVEDYINEAKKKSDLERTELQKEKTGVKLEGVKAINPINNAEVDVWVADYVLASYGTGAVMAVPAHDDRDFEFAKKYGIEVKEVIVSKDEKENNKGKIADAAFVDCGVLINSQEFDGLSSEEAKKKITEKLIALDAGEFQVNFKLRDWVFSRQHYWGEPIPIIHCDKCGMVPMQEDELPLTLPEVEKYEPTDTGESPLAAIESWVNTKCPLCGGTAKRETDTMPNWAGSSWYFLRYADPKNDQEFASQDKLKYWLPVDLYNGGMEHTTLHLLYSRFWHKFLYDLGVVPTLEPYQKRIVHGIILGPDGQKMSKSKGNVINPDDIVKKYGADSMRSYIMFIGPYDQESAWSTAGLQGVYRFLHRVWRNGQKVDEKANTDTDLMVKINKYVAAVTDDVENFRLNTYVAKLMEINNELDKMKQVPKEIMETLLKLLAPAGPHISEEIWEMLGNKESIFAEAWPKPEEKYLVEEYCIVGVQVNGKLRGTVKIKVDADENEAKKLVENDAEIMKWIENKKIVKMIYKPGKIISYVIAG